MASLIDTAAKRGKLPFRRNPYWQGVSGGRGGLSLGFRPSRRDAGTWIAKIVVDGHRFEERIGAVGSGETPGALTFTAALAAVLEWGKRQASGIEAGRMTSAVAKIPTVRLVVEEYAVARRARAGRSGSERSLKLHVLNDREFAAIRIAKLVAGDIEGWRSRLPIELKATTKNRMLNDLRAALNAAAVKHRRTLPAFTVSEIKVGTKAESAGSAPRRQLLTDKQVRAAVDEAFEIDQDFGELVILAAGTGARFSQLTQLDVVDLQLVQRRIMMPSSNKGRNREPRTKVAIPLSASVLDRFASGFADRPLDEPLLQRWWHKKAGGPGKWIKERRDRWKYAFEINQQWAEVVKRASLPSGTVMYALRHSSIVRGLRAGLPVRLVAALHDTSVEMIEKHYAAYIVDMTEDLARRALMSFEHQPPLETGQ